MNDDTDFWETDVRYDWLKKTTEASAVFTKTMTSEIVIWRAEDTLWAPIEWR
jgi:hypothetical protein